MSILEKGSTKRRAVAGWRFGSRRWLGVALALLVLTPLIYWPLSWGGFVFDPRDTFGSDDSAYRAHEVNSAWLVLAVSALPALLAAAAAIAATVGAQVPGRRRLVGLAILAAALALLLWKSGVDLTGVQEAQRLWPLA